MDHETEAADSRCTPRNLANDSRAKSHEEKDLSRELVYVSPANIFNCFRDSLFQELLLN